MGARDRLNRLGEPLDLSSALNERRLSRITG